MKAFSWTKTALALRFSADGCQVFVERVAISVIRAPSLKQVFWLGVPKAGCSEVSLGILAGSNVQLRPNTYTVGGKSLNRFQQTLRGRRRALPGRRQRIPGTFPVGRSDNGSRRETDAAHLAVETMAECQPDFHRNWVYEGETEPIFTGFRE